MQVGFLPDDSSASPLLFGVISFFPGKRVSLLHSMRIREIFTGNHSVQEDGRARDGRIGTARRFSFPREPSLVFHCFIHPFQFDERERPASNWQPGWCWCDAFGRYDIQVLLQGSCCVTIAGRHFRGHIGKRTCRGRQEPW